MSKNMLRVFYKWPVITDFMSKLMSNLKDGKTLHFEAPVPPDMAELIHALEGLPRNA